MSDEILKVTSFFGERDRVGGRFVSDALLAAYADAGVAASTVFRATSGFGRHHHLREDRTLTLSEDPSLMVVALDSTERVEAVLTRVCALQPRGLVTVERAAVRADVDAWPDRLAEANRLSIQIGRGDRIDGRPAYLAVCALLQEHGADGASVLAGVDGTRGGVRQRAGFLDRNAGVPTMVLALGSGAVIRGVLPPLQRLLDRRTFTVERVRVCKRDGQLLARPQALPDVDDGGRPLWQKLAVYSSESQLHEGRPLHRELVRALRDAGARGATSVRGVWGFHGDHAPHGDRLWQGGRHVPVLTLTLDRPSRIASLFDVVDHVTREHGLVTSELVPGLADAPTIGIGLASYDY